MEQRLEVTVAAENARRSRKVEANKVLQKEGVLYSANAHHMNCERLELEKKREKEREEAWQKKYDTACSKVYRTANKAKKTWRSQYNWNINIYRHVIMELEEHIDDSRR